MNQSIMYLFAVLAAFFLGVVFGGIIGWECHEMWMERKKKGGL
jgi:hypothetical protein